MQYNFPIIQNINDVLPAIEGRPEFVVAERQGYTVLNYNVVLSDTFPPLNGAFCPQMNALRRECRGIIFCSQTGRILRRPFHKFFNVSEREETQEHLISLLDDNHIILEKLDGSMIAPFDLGGEIRWGTKMGLTDVAVPAESYVRDNPSYAELANSAIHGFGVTPIFEWCSRKQRIVLDYPEDRLVLTAARDIETGHYMRIEMLKSLGDSFGIPVVNSFTPQTHISEFVALTRDLVETEGFVVRFHDGHMVKLKSDWYVQIHKAKESILQDKNIVELVLTNKLDDIKVHLLAEDVRRLNEFETNINETILSLANDLCKATDDARTAGDRKNFALNLASNFDAYTKAAIFSLWDDNSFERALSVVKKTVGNNLSRNAKWEELRDIWFGGITFN